MGRMQSVVVRGGQVLRDLLISMRPKQWSKNVFVFAGLVFAVRLFDPYAVAEALLAFALFCLASSAVYLINDVTDIERDRAHPVKRNRPLASGRLRPGVAIAAAVLLIAISVPAAFWLSLYFGAILLTYLLLMVAYSFCLKNVVILDIMAIAFGFVLRAAGGAVAIRVSISHWLFVCTILLALFLGLAKRRHELLLLEQNAGSHRHILSQYSPALLEELLAIVAASTVIAYSLYTVYGPNPRLPTYEYVHDIPYMMLTIPFVIYAIFRYLFLVYQKNKGGSPEEILLGDFPFLLNLLLWGIAVLVILYVLR
ncbi:MAG: decaprenyl-phosphate phosphoribosyltransferase [Chloroflexia bacterium]